MSLQPVPLTRQALVTALVDMADAVAAEDSFEGFIEYLLPTGDLAGADELPPEERAYAMVRASYRIGNRLGQGGTRTIGEER